MRIRNRVCTAPDGSCGPDDHTSDEGFEEKEGGRFLMPLIAAALDAECDFGAGNERKVSQKEISGNVRGNGWRDLLLSWKDTAKENGARFKQWEIQSRGIGSLREGIANPESKEKKIGRCSAKQMPSKATATSPTRVVAESSECSTDFQRQTTTCDSAEKKKPKESELEIAETETRCKRRNGKGWRCSGTRVRGYSLCEHHLSRTQALPSKKKKTTKENALDAGSGFHPPPAINGADSSAQEYAAEYEQKKARRMEMKLQVKKQRKKRSLKDINLVLDHDHHHNGSSSQSSSSTAYQGFHFRAP